MNEKHKELRAVLDRGIAMIHLDARPPPVDVPAYLKNEYHLRLNLSYRYRLPTLDIDDEKIIADLSFGGQMHRCIIPWHHVFAITSALDNEGRIWIEYTPAEVLMKEAAPTAVVPTEPTLPEEPKKRERPSWMKVIDGGKTE